MKKKIILILGLSLLFESVHAMDYLHRAAGLAWDHKIAIAGIGFFAKSLMVYNRVRNCEEAGIFDCQDALIQQNVKSFLTAIASTKEEDLRNQADISREIFEMVKSWFPDNDVFILKDTRHEDPPGPICTALAIKINKKVLLFVNSDTVYASKRPDSILYFGNVTKNHIIGMMHHEKGHIINNDYMKGVVVKSAFPLFNFFVGWLGYQGVRSLTPPSNALLSIILPFCSGVLSYELAKKSNRYIWFAYLRHVERLADRGVVNTGDKKIITGFRDLLDIILQKNPDQNTENACPWYLLAHPLLQERIDFFDRELVKLQSSGAHGQQGGLS